MTDVRVVALDELDRAVVDQVHELLHRCIPPDELITGEELHAAHGRGPDAEPSAVVLREGSPVAVMLAERFAGGRVLLLSYVAVEPAARGAGIGAALVGEVLEDWADGAVVVAEVAHPRWHPGDADTGDGASRLRFYGRLGARLLPAPYVQPSLRPGLPRVPGLLLIRLDAGGPVPPEPLELFLEEYYSACEGPASLQDPVVTTLLSRVGELADPSTSWHLDRHVELPGPSDALAALPGRAGDVWATGSRRS